MQLTQSLQIIMKFLFINLLSISASLAFFTVYASEQIDAEYVLPYVKILHVNDLSQLAETSEDESKLILIEVSATECGFCELLEEDYIKPMLRSEAYTSKLLIRKLDLDNPDTIVDFSGDSISTIEFALRYKARLTPTMLFLDSEGKEVGERIVGINTLELFGGYIEASIENGMKAVSNNK
jgi:thioredoxin-related protein